MLRFAVFLVLVLAEQADAQCPAGVQEIANQRCIRIGTKVVQSYFKGMQECFSTEKGQLLHSFEDFDKIKAFINDNKVADIDGYIMGDVVNAYGRVYNILTSEGEVKTFIASNDAWQDVTQDISFRTATGQQHTAILTKRLDQRAVVSKELFNQGLRLGYICEHEYTKV